jgi:hypothetical protein
MAVTAGAGARKSRRRNDIVLLYRFMGYIATIRKGIPQNGRQSVRPDAPPVFLPFQTIFHICVYFAPSKTEYITILYFLPFRPDNCYNNILI